MVDKNNTPNRREMLKGMASIGPVALLGAQVGQASAENQQLVDEELELGDDPIPVASEKGSLVDPSRGNLPERIRSGNELLEFLVENGPIDEASFEALPNTGYEMRAHGHTEVGMRVETDQGDLQITFTPLSAPFAYLYRDDGIVSFHITSDMEYTRKLVDEDDAKPSQASGTLVSNTKENQSNSGCSDSCGGCVCTFAPPCRLITGWYMVRCTNCFNGNCFTTDRCGC